MCAGWLDESSFTGLERGGTPADCADAHAHHDPFFAEACEKATTLAASSEPWLKPGASLKLNAHRWKFWGEMVPGAIGQVDWIWSKGPPPPSDHPNHKSAQEHAEQLGQQLDDCAAQGMIEWIPEGMPVREFVTNILPLGARVKPNGSVRMLVDPSLPGVNDAMADMPCPLPTVESIFSQLRPGMVLGRRDLKNGFYHGICSPAARKHMGFRHPVTGRIGRWVVLPQGTKQSPALFCAMSEASARIFRRIFAALRIPVWIEVYMDDYVLWAESHDALRTAFDVMDDEAAELGLEFCLEKDRGRDAPLTCMDALGIELDTVAMTMRLPPGKRDSYLAAVEEFRTTYQGRASCPRKPLEQLLGKLVFACRVCRWGFLFIQELCDQLFPVGSYPPPKSVPLTEGVWHDLEFWARALGPAYGTWVGLSQHMVGRRQVDVDASKFQVQLFTDASKQFGVGGVLGLESLSQRWARDVSEEHIGALELEALLVALRHWAHELTNCRVLARMDNIQAVCAVNKGASRKPALRATLLEIALLGLQRGFEVKATHVKGEDNPADAPSRGLAPTRTSDFTFAHFERFNSPRATVDCCAAADGYNVQPGCTQWFSVANPVQNNVPALMGKVLWANIPFSQVGSVLDAIAEAWRRAPLTTVATCVVPEWPTASWYRKYLRRKHPLFRVLHRYPAGSRIFFKRNTRSLAGPCPFPILVIRMGGRAN